MSLLELLQQGRVDEFNASRGRYASPDLFAADLSNLMLPGVDLSGANLEKADLSGADLTGAILMNANLSGADCTGTQLTRIVALRSKWRDAWLGDAILDDAELGKADFTDAGMPGLRAVGARFTRARLKGVDLSSSSLQNADFNHANLAEANLNRSILDGASFVEATLEKAKLEKAIAENVNFTQARLIKVSAIDTCFRKSIFEKADLSGSDLRRADMESAILSQADLAGCEVEGTSFRCADMRGARLDGTDTSGADLRDIIPDDPIAPEPVEGEVEDAHLVQFDGAMLALSGNTIGLLWENEDRPGTSTLRVTTGALDQPWDQQTEPLIKASETIVARAILPGTAGFTLALFLSRPGGMIVRLVDMSAMGDIGVTRNIPFDYALAVRPLFLPDADGFFVLGLARTGPTLHVHRFDGERFVPVYSSKITTARGFVGQIEPLVYCKGGVVIPVTTKEARSPLRSPEGFPGRGAASARIGEDLLLAWLPIGEHGLRLSLVHPNGGVENVALHSNCGVSSLDMLALPPTDLSPARVLLVYTLEGESLRTNSTLHATLFPDLTNDTLWSEPGEDLEELRFIASPTPLLSAMSSDGSLLLFEIDGLKATLRLRFQSNCAAVESSEDEDEP